MATFKKPFKKAGAAGNVQSKAAASTKPTHHMRVSQSKEEREAGADIEFVDGIGLWAKETQFGELINVSVSEGLAPGRYTIYRNKNS